MAAVTSCENALYLKPGSLKKVTIFSDGSRPSDKGGWGGGWAVSKKIFFRPLGPHFSLKVRRGGGRTPRAPPLDPQLI